MLNKKIKESLTSATETTLRVIKLVPVAVGAYGVYFFGLPQLNSQEVVALLIAGVTLTYAIRIVK